MGDKFLSFMGQCVRTFFSPSLELYSEAQGGFLEGASEEQVAVLRDIIVFTMRSDKYFTDAIKVYLAQYSISQADFVQSHDINFNTFHTQVRRGKQRMQSDFGTDFLFELTGRYTIGTRILDPVRVKHYRFLYNKVIGSENKLYDVLDLDLSSKRGGFTDEALADDQWSILFTMLNMYTPLQRHAVAHNITEQDVGYLNYLLCSSDVNETDKKRQEQLFKLITDNQRYIQSVTKK